MALTQKNWALNGYTNATWTDLVAEPAILATIVVSNPSAGSVNVSIRLEDAAASLCTIVPLTTIATLGTYVLDLRSLSVTGTQSVQIYADVAGAEFMASGAV